MWKAQEGFFFRGARDEMEELTIYSINTGTLVIAAQQKEILRILDFVRQQQAYRFQRLFTSIYVVA